MKVLLSANEVRDAIIEYTRQRLNRPNAIIDYIGGAICIDDAEIYIGEQK